MYSIFSVNPDTMRVSLCTKLNILLYNEVISLSIILSHITGPLNHLYNTNVDI